jgi:hypothetical protein
MATASEPTRVFQLDTVAARWQSALDSAQRALTAAGGRFGLPAAELDERRRKLVQERQETAQLLVALARDTRVPAPRLSPVPRTPRMLGLDGGVRACLFDLDFVLTDSAALHASAWAEVFDELLLRLADATGSRLRPFDRVADYRAYVEGRPRLEGVHAFLDSRGIRVADRMIRRQRIPPTGSPGARERYSHGRCVSTASRPSPRRGPTSRRAAKRAWGAPFCLRVPARLRCSSSPTLPV